MEIIASKDTLLHKALPGMTSASGQQVVSVANHALYSMRGLFSFPVAENVSRAILRLHYRQWEIYNPVGKPLHVYKVISDWDEQYACWNNRKKDTPWNSPGGDIGQEIAYAVIPQSVDQYGFADSWMEWDVTGFVSPPAFDVMVKFSAEEYDWYIYGKVYGVSFSSREYPDAGLWPRLDVDYEPAGESLKIPIDRFKGMTIQNNQVIIDQG